MKELSIQEKARAYDKAREKIALRFGSNVAEEIFSEFEESEDEKIRKFLIKCVEQPMGTDFLGDIKKEDVIDWLEKQGQTFTKKNVDDAYLKGVCDTKHELEKQCEQKPAWNEEDEMIALSIEQVMNCASLLNIVPEKIDKIRTWLKSLKDRIGGKL